MTPKQRRNLLEYTTNEIETDFWVDYDEHYRFKTDKCNCLAGYEILIDSETGEVFFCKLHDDGFVMQRNPADKKTIAELDAKLIDQAKQLTQQIKGILKEIENAKTES